MTRPAPWKRTLRKPTTGSRGPRSAPDRQQRPRKRKQASTGRRTPAGPAATGPAQAPPAGQEHREPPQIASRNAGHRHRPQLRPGPREAPARAAKAGKPQDTRNAGTLDSRPGRAQERPQDRQRPAQNTIIYMYSNLYIKYTKTSYIILLFCHNCNIAIYII